MRSEGHRQSDRVAWTRRMVAKSYSSLSDLADERQLLAKSEHELRKTEGEYELFRRFQAPGEILKLRSQAEIEGHKHGLEAERLRGREARLAYVRKNIEHCRLIAPHDGFAIHAERRNRRLEPFGPGVRVKQDEDLFILPDTDRMDVEVSVHETMGLRVREGMRARVSIAAIAGRVFDGKVLSIIPFPIPNEKEWDESLRHFIARVRLDDTPPGVLPLMSATVEIDTGRVPEALVIPVEAMGMIGNHQFCYVATSSGVERRPIQTGRSSIDFLEITEGLMEGERVVPKYAEALSPEPRRN